MGATHQKFEARRLKIAPRHNGPHPSLSQLGEGWTGFPACRVTRLRRRADKGPSRGTQKRAPFSPPFSPLSGKSGGEGRGVGIEALKRLIIERTEGNPFFMEEMVQTLFEQG